MQIIKLNSSLYIEYEEFIKQFPNAILYYSIKFKEFLEAMLKCECQYLLAFDKHNEMQAILPIMRTKGKFGYVYNSLPFYGSNGGILSKTSEAKKLLLDEFNKISNLADTAVNMFVSNPLIDSSNNEPVYDLTDIRIGQFTSINHSEDIANNLLESFHSKTRNMIRKAEKGGIKTYIDNNDFEFLEITHEENMKAIGGKAKSSRFFTLVPDIFNGNTDYKIYIATKDNIKVAGLLLFYYNDVVEYYTPVVKNEYRTFQPLSLLIYNAMIDASECGYKLWNWGGTWLSQEGVYRFKKRFGAFDKEYKYYIKINNENIYASTKEELQQEYKGFYTVPFNKLT